MARSSGINDLAYLAVVGGAGFLLFRMAEQGSLGAEAQRAALDVRRAVAGEGSRAARPVLPREAADSGAAFQGAESPHQPAQDLNLFDLGGQPLRYDDGAICQDLGDRKGNCYAPGDVFRDGAGNLWLWAEWAYLVSPASGERRAVGDFFRR